MRYYLLIALAAGCGGGGNHPVTPVPDMAMTSCTQAMANAGANKTQQVATSILLPATRTDYAIDLNGDGRLDNQLSSLVAILKSQGTDANVQIANGIASGDQILLFDQSSADATYQTDSCAGADVFTGKAMAMPNLTGGGHFTIDTTVPSGNFNGTITAGDFESLSPLLQVTPVALTLELVLFTGRSVALPIIGAQLKMVRDTSGKISGEIHGAIKQADVQSSVLPAFAAELVAQVAADPHSMASQQILAFFDTGGSPAPDQSCGGACQNPDGSCAKASDGKLDLCEITTNALVLSEVQSDVQMYSDDGTTYQPSAANMHKDSLSLGIGFTTATATF